MCVCHIGIARQIQATRDVHSVGRVLTVTHAVNIGKTATDNATRVKTVGRVLTATHAASIGATATASATHV